MEKESLTIWTIGHSTRTITEFLELLAANEIQVLADVRRFPASRKYPHFNQDELSRVLTATGIEYLSFPELGGRRRPLPDSHNTAWRNDSFRGYADYMETEAFLDGVKRLINAAQKWRTAILCAESLWWRCHRALIADYLKVRGMNVVHILDGKKNESHPFTSAAKIRDGKLSYTN